MSEVFTAFDYGNGADSGAKDQTRTLTWYATGYETETTAKAAVSPSVPDDIAITGGPGKLFQKSLSWNREGPSVWKFTAQYVHPDKLDTDNDTGDWSWSFNTMGAREKMTASLETISRTARTGEVAANFQGLIGYDGKKASGVDVVVPKLEFEIVKRQANATLTTAYVKTLAGLTGRTNDATWNTWNAGELLFLGARGRQEAAADPEVTYSFVASENITSLDVGGITVPAKSGHEFLWIYYRPEEDATAKALISTPYQVNVERVYQTADFDDLAI